MRTRVMAPFAGRQAASVSDQRSPGGVPVRISIPRQANGGTLVYLHGGGWVVGDVEVDGVAPAIVATAEFDPLRDEGAAYAARPTAAGVPVEYVPGPGLIHGLAAFPGVVDAADAVTATVLALLSRALRAGA